MKWQWILFVIGTAACWGAYVPMLHEGQNAIGATKGPLRAFLCVGIAYFATASSSPFSLAIISFAFVIKSRLKTNIAIPISRRIKRTENSLVR